MRGLLVQASLTVRATPARSSTALASSSVTGVRSPRSAPSCSTTSKPSSKRAKATEFDMDRMTDTNELTRSNEFLYASYPSCLLDSSGTSFGPLKKCWDAMGGHNGALMSHDDG